METTERPTRKRSRWPIPLALIVVSVLIYTQLTIFVIPPIGMLPEGRTIVILRLNKTEFIDSPDAMCARMQGGVSLLCRGMILGVVGEAKTELFQLPYSRTLYLVSTDGKTYDL